MFHCESVYIKTARLVLSDKYFGLYSQMSSTWYRYRKDKYNFKRMEHLDYTVFFIEKKTETNLREMIKVCKNVEGVDRLCREKMFGFFPLATAWDHTMKFIVC